MAKGAVKEIIITLNFSGTEKKFINTGQLREFFISQWRGWSWLELAAQKDGNLYQVWDTFKVYLDQADHFIRWYEMVLDDSELITKQVIDFVDKTRTAVNHGFILAETPKAHFIFELKDNKSPQIAAYALASLNNTKIKANNYDAQEGLRLALEYLQRYKPDPVRDQHKILEERNKLLISETTALQERSALLIKKAEDQVAMQTSVFETQVAKQASILERQIVEHASALENLSIEQAKVLENQVAKQASDFEITLDETRKKLADFQAHLKEKVALEESVEYWTKKRAQHETAMQVAARRTVVIAGSTLVVFILAVIIILATTTGEVSPVKISILVALSTFGVWITRLSTKIFISNLHLGADAYERVTMFQTYFALLAEGKGLNDDNREIILQTLFRPSSTGIVNDDGPTNIIETLVKALKRR